MLFLLMTSKAISLLTLIIIGELTVDKKCIITVQSLALMVVGVEQSQASPKGGADFKAKQSPDSVRGPDFKSKQAPNHIRAGSLGDGFKSKSSPNHGRY